MGAERSGGQLLLSTDVEEGRTLQSSGIATSSELAPFAKPREYIWDNLKGICVLFVVLVHCIMTACGNAAYLSDPVSSGLVTVLIFVVMPGFTFVSGHLSSAELTSRRRVGLARTWAVVMVHQLLWTLVYTAMSQKDPSIRTAWLPLPFWSTGGVVWFLFCLAVWRTILPLLSMLRWPVATTIAISTLALFMDSSRSMIFQPVFTFLPFFMAGFQTSSEALHRWRRQAAARYIFAGALGLATLASWVLPQVGDTGAFSSFAAEVWSAYACLYGDLMKEAMIPEHCTNWAAPLLHLGFLAVAFLLILGFLGCVPEQRVWGLTRAGAMSIYIYLLHMYGIVAGAAVLTVATRQTHISKEDEVVKGLIHGPLALLGALAFGVLLWACLGHGCVRYCCRLCVEPRVEFWLQAEEGTLVAPCTVQMPASGSSQKGAAAAAHAQPGLSSAAIAPRPSVSLAAANLR